MTNAIREALVELVACEDLRVRAGKISPVEPGCEREVLYDEYRRRSPTAWHHARTALASLEQASTPSVEPVAWFKHGPYEGDEPLVCVFDDPHDEDCYTPLYAHPPIPAPESAESICRCDLMCNRIAHGLPLSRETPKGAEQPAPQTESRADAMREAVTVFLMRYDQLRGDREDAPEFTMLRCALAAAEPTNSKGAEQAAETLRRLATEALAWMDSSVTDKPYSLCRNLRAALASPPTQEGDGARERVSAAKESK